MLSRGSELGMGEATAAGRRESKGTAVGSRRCSTIMLCLSGLPELARLTCVVTKAVPPGVIERIVEVLDPEEVWLFGSRARQTHGPDSDWDLMAVLPDAAPDTKLDIAAVWGALRDLRRIRVEVFPIRRRDFEEDRDIPGEL